MLERLMTSIASRPPKNDVAPKASSLTRPYFLSLADHIGEKISQQELAPGDRLPPHRELSYQTGLSVPTISRAYAELAARGLVAGEVGRGTFVQGPLPVDVPYLPAALQGVIDLSIIKPVSDPIHLSRLKSELASIAAELPPEILFAARPSYLDGKHRESARTWLARLGVETSAANIQITNGGMPAATVALMAAARPGSVVVTEGTGLHSLPQLTSYLGIELHGLPIDDQGVLPDAFESACRQRKVSAFFCAPGGASPTAYMINAARRAELVSVAEKHGVLIIEDDVFGALGEPGTTFHSLAPDRTLYFTSFTKCIAPGLRVGYLAVPDRFVPAVENRHMVTNWMATPMVTEVATRWVRSGIAAELVDRQRAAIARRHKITAGILGDGEYRSHPAGLHVWLPLGEGQREEEFVVHARRHNIAVARGSVFGIGGRTQPAAVRVSLGSTGEAELESALRILRGLLSSELEPALLGF